MSKNTTYGTCKLCGKRMSRAGMTRHLESCSPRHDPDGKRYRVFRIRIEDARSPVYWMDVELWAGERLPALDDFLRGIWCECCDHLSEFRIDGMAYSARAGTEWSWREERALDVRLDKVLSMGAELDYTYDFGSSTTLKLRVTGDRKGNTGDETVRLLSRNEAPELSCRECGSPATSINVYAWLQGEDAGFCDEHVPEESFETFLLPVVNSPRMGVCGYTGPPPTSQFANL